ncbi:DUF4493 domain-containing protein [Phocaeicola sp.]|uniref:DUF4493 domain-containing protein n=1 Tax=Phocaeicola sp. TaxID=2773926 RepID=UPI003AB30654
MNKSVIEYMKWIGCLCLLVLCMVLGGCQSDEETALSGKTGLLITLTDEEHHAYSRTAPSELEDPVTEKFQLKVVYSGTDKSAYKGSCKEFILLEEGTYDLTATYGDNPVLALDAPYYAGTLEGQEVIKGQMTSASIPCFVANSLLSVIYNKTSLDKLYESYYVTVSVGSESVNLDADSGKSAYFRAGSSVKLVFHGFLSGTGKEVTYDIPDQEKFANIPVKTHVKVTLGLDESNITSGVGISIEKLETETVSISETIPMEYLPKPKLESDDFVNNELSFAETEKKSAVIRLKLSSGLQDLKLKFNSADAKFAGLEQGKEYLLSNAEDKSAVETALGITLPEIGATEAALDFTSLVPQLMTDKGTTVASTVEVDVEANNRWASEDASANRIYTLTCNKPELYLVTNPGNFWSKEFSVDSCDIKTGDVETISQKLQYQYRKKGDEQWINCDRLVQFDDYPADKQYQVRAVYREGIETEPVDVELETPQQLPNSGMEEWYYQKVHSGGWLSDNIYSIYPWTNGSDSFWDTNNDFTTRNRGTFAKTYNSFPAISFVKNAHSGTWAAELRSTGNGRGNTLPNNVLEMNRVAGELFTGTVQVNTGGTDATPIGDQYTIDKNRSFNVRPTALSFWYKYVPYGSDTYRALIQLIDAEGNVIIESSYESSDFKNDWTNAVVRLNYENGKSYAKCTKIFICFSSTINTGENMSYQKGSYSIWLDKETNFEPVWYGSILTIDDISLIFDK